MTTEQQKLAAYARRILTGGTSMESAGPMGGPAREAAAGGLEAALNDRDLSIAQHAALEAVIHKEGRPALLIKQDSFDEPPDLWAHLLVEKDALKPVIQAIGRVEVLKISGPFGGTGFFCAPNVIMTNRHVAELFTYGVGGPSKLKFTGYW
jgi:endonuclease G, mitochondrial